MKSVFERVLVDMDEFEPSTSSMPLKKFQSLTGILTKNKRLGRRQFGRHGLSTGSWYVACFPARGCRLY